MLTTCQEINLAVKKAKLCGNNVKEIVDGWTKMKSVIYMTSPLTSDLKKTIEDDIKDLRYCHSEGSPHYPDEEYFICDEHSTAISFPIKK